MGKTIAERNIAARRTYLPGFCGGLMRDADSVCRFPGVHSLAIAAIRRFHETHPDIAIDRDDLNAAGIIERMRATSCRCGHPAQARPTLRPPE
jgi:hypothetical protein